MSENNRKRYIALYPIELQPVRIRADGTRTRNLVSLSEVTAYCATDKVILQFLFFQAIQKQPRPLSLA